MPLLFLGFAWSRFGLATANPALCTFCFLMMHYFALSPVISARERSWFWRTFPSKTLLSAMIADALIGTTLTLVGIPDLVALPWWQSLAIFGYAMVACLGVNDSLKVAMIKWRVPVSVAWNPGDLIRPRLSK